MTDSERFGPPIPPKSHQEMPILAYSTRYDAFYEIRTGKWTEGKCGDPDCDYCKDRPETANYVEIRAKGVKIVSTT